MPTHYQGKPAEVRALDLIIKLSRCHESLNHRLEAGLEEAGLTTSQFGVLEALWHLGPLYLSELAKKLLRTGGNLTLVVSNLERDGLVRRHRVKEDGRYYQIQLTAKGERHIRKVFPRHLALLVELAGALQPAEQKELGRLCRKLGASPLSS